MKIHLAHSPDSDDAFMFHALANGKIDTGDVTYDHVLVDIQTLNERARQGAYEVTALSAHAWAHVADRYEILVHGGSIGLKYGPIVVAREDRPLESFRTIAVPGLLTSAYLALRLRHPGFREKVMPFDSILEAVAEGREEAGLLIHEGQLTYMDRGLKRIEELGEWWFRKTNLPLPMGVNAIRADLPEDLKRTVSSHLRASIRYALDHRQEALDHALKYGRGLERDVADRFVAMWVNERTLDMGPEGKEAIRLLLAEGAAKGIVPPVPALRFRE